MTTSWEYELYLYLAVLAMIVASEILLGYCKPGMEDEEPEED